MSLTLGIGCLIPRHADPFRQVPVRRADVVGAIRRFSARK